MKSMRFWRVPLAVVALVAAWHGSVSSDFPYAQDKLLAQFAQWAPAVHRPVFTDVIDEDGKGVVACSSVIVRATEQSTYLLTVAHCVESTRDRKVLGITVEGERATVLPARNGTNTVRIIRIGKSMYAPPVVFAAKMPVGTRTFAFGYAFNYGGFPVFSTNVVNAEPTFDIPGTGDTLHSAESFYGWSGGGVFVYNEQAARFELMALTEEFLGTIVSILPVFSDFVFAYSVSNWVLEAIEGDIQTPVQQVPQVPSGKQYFANWEAVPEELKQRWQAWYDANAQYLLKPFYAVEVEGVVIRIGPQSAVYDAWLHDRLKIIGPLQDVDWSEFFWEG